MIHNTGYETVQAKMLLTVSVIFSALLVAVTFLYLNYK